jgi:hypothetical protein
VEYSTSTELVTRGDSSREYRVHQHMNSWASKGWRLVTASCRNLPAGAGGAIVSLGIEYVFFWVRD